MTHAILTALAQANLALAAAIAVVLLLRGPARRAFGAQAAYALWAMVPLAGLAVLAPRPETTTLLAPVVLEAARAAARVAPAASMNGADAALVTAWIAGVVAATAVLALRQARFVAGLGRLVLLPGGVLRAERNGVGPAVVGALRPRIVTPADFETRFAPEEQAVILRHEATHLARGDALANALAAALACVCWFNPLVHLAIRRLRIDQELACDAAVLARFPQARRFYAEVLLKTQLAAQPLPLGCHWPATGVHPLKERIVMLNAPLPAPARRIAGGAAVALLSAAGAAAAWAAQPPPTPLPHAVPDWTQRPTAKDVAWAYPPAAEAANLAGRATLDCRIDGDGRLVACRVASEAPLDAGFGEAAMKLAPQFQMKALDRNGRSTKGATVRIPIRFIVPQAGA